MYRDNGFKNIIIKILVFQIIIFLLVFFFVENVLERAKLEIVNRDRIIVARLLEGDSIREDDIISYITKEYSLDDLEAGNEILRKYGYDESTPIESVFILAGLRNEILIGSMTISMFFTIILLILIKIEYKKTDKKLEELILASDKVIQSDFSSYLDESGEGNFSILNHRFNQMNRIIKNNIDQSNREKIFLKNMISDISHQMKTPLSSLSIFNDILLDSDIGEEERIDFLKKGRTQIDRMKWLIINLLKSSKIEAGAIEFKKEVVPVSIMIGKALDVIGKKADISNIEIIGDRKIKFYGDENWTIEALVNIIKNGIEHGGENIKIEIRESEVFIRVIIRDDGEGIDPKDLPNIFKRFYKSGESKKDDSIGIGLYLSKLIIEGQNGTIEVKSQKNLGTDFIITFIKIYN